MPGHHHRASNLRQQNKKNKRSKSSKRSLSRTAGGKINGRAHSQKAAFAQSKADRRNKLQQKREAKRAELLRRKRGISGSTPPRIIGIISLGANEKELEEKIRSAILEGADKTGRTLSETSNVTISAKFDVHRKDGSLTVLTNSTAFRQHYGDCEEIDAAVQSSLDLCRICDMVLFVIDADGSRTQEILDMQIGGDDGASLKSSKSRRQTWDHLISERGDSILHAVKAQGMPSLLTVLAHTEIEEQDADFMSVKSAKSIRRAQTKRSLNLKKYASRFASTEFGPDNDNVMEVNISHLYENKDEMEDSNKSGFTKRVDIVALIRALCTKAASPPKWVGESPRPYILSDSHQYDSPKNELKISGYVRGKVPFSVNSLVHVANLGTCACKSIEMAEHPFSRRQDTMDTSSALLVADPNEREPLEMFATPDALEGEQNLVGFDDDDDFDDGMTGADVDPAPTFSRPAGWSDYQSAWLDAVDDLGAEEAGFDRGELADELNKKTSAASVAAQTMDLDEANDISTEEKRLLQEQRKKEQTEHQDFPDEVEVDEDENARDRFARYRSLKSFKKTYWDPKENLPESYGSIFHFSSFKATQRSVMQDMRDVADEAAVMEGQFGFTTPLKKNDDVEMDGGSDEDEDLLLGYAPVGSYVTITLEGVTTDAMKMLSRESLLVAVALLAHENKMSVLHAGLSQSSGCSYDQELPVKSKDVLTFRCGWRTWKAKPVFSQNNLNCNKHKFERFMPTNGAFFAATFFGPVSYTPCPVLVFRAQKGKSTELCAAGSMIGADADRIVVKRIILTGFPVRVHKRHATVKYMFYNPEDVKWFKPAGLWTKHGLNGNIIESVGEHGTMKVLFNAPIKQHDTVCLPLYKRIFPKLANELANESSDSSVKHSQRGPKPVLIVR